MVRHTLASCGRWRESAGTVPAETTSFVGRRGEVTKAKRLLSTARLVTLTGVAGVGKTRLALRVHQILRRLDDYFEFLAEGSRVSVPRLRTLRATIDWSFDLDAAEAVCAGEAVLDVVDGLVDKSILTRANGAAMARYRTLEPIRQYGQQRLASSGQRTAVRTRS